MIVIKQIKLLQSNSIISWWEQIPNWKQYAPLHHAVKFTIMGNITPKNCVSLILFVPLPCLSMNYLFLQHQSRNGKIKGIFVAKKPII